MDHPGHRWGCCLTGCASCFSPCRRHGQTAAAKPASQQQQQQQGDRGGSFYCGWQLRQHRSAEELGVVRGALRPRQAVWSVVGCMLVYLVVANVTLDTMVLQHGIFRCCSSLVKDRQAAAAHPASQQQQLGARVASYPGGGSYTDVGWERGLVGLGTHLPVSRQVGVSLGVCVCVCLCGALRYPGHPCCCRMACCASSYYYSRMSEVAERVRQAAAAR